MSRLLRALPGLEPGVAFLRQSSYGAGYTRARNEAIGRARGMCQCCGRRRATEAHHRALRYPPDREVTAADLIAVCGPCHWRITFRRLLDRAGDPSEWLLLATGLESRFPSAPRAEGGMGGRRRVARDQPRSCRAPAPAPAPRRAGKRRELDLWSLVVRCHLMLVVGCLACDRFVRLDTVERFRRHRWSGSVADLRRGLWCCRCRSRTQWVLLARWPPAGARPPRFPVRDPRDPS